MSTCKKKQSMGNLRTYRGRFVETDLNTLFHLRNLLEARTADPVQVKRELDSLIEGNLSDSAFQAL